MESERWLEIEQLYHAALERDERARAAFLAKACGGDESLRREVESLLESDAQAGSFIESPAIEVAARSMAVDGRLQGSSILVKRERQSGAVRNTSRLVRMRVSGRSPCSPSMRASSLSHAGPAKTTIC